MEAISGLIGCYKVGFIECDIDGFVLAKLTKVLDNLMSNAVKYTPDGTISVEAYAQHGRVAIVVGDTGIGIAPSEQERIFEPFYRSRRDKRFPQGMGLGLTIVRLIADLHGGSVMAQNRAAGDGVVFVVRIPAV